jgi:hypothetical protein
MMTRTRNKTEKHSKLLLPDQPKIALTFGKGKVNIMGKSLLLAGMLTGFCANLFGQSINSVTTTQCFNPWTVPDPVGISSHHSEEPEICPLHRN